MKVKFVLNTDIENGFHGLTIGNTYTIMDEYKFPCGKKVYMIEADDDGDENELYEGEFEVIE